MATTNAGAIGVTLSADTVQFDSAMDKSAAVAERSMQRTSRAQAAAAKDADRLIQSIQKQVDTFGMSGTQLMAYEARLKGISDKADPLIERLNKMKDAQAAFNTQAGSAGAVEKLNAGLKEAATNAEHVSGAHAGITRELIVLGHEASQGNFKRFGGSLLVLAEYSTKAQAAIAAMMGPLGAVAAVAAIFAAAAIKGAIEQAKFNRELVLTGNYSAITADGLNSMSAALALTTHATIGESRSMVEALAATGDVAPRLIGPMADAMLRVQKASGETTEEVVKNFEKMAEAPTVWTAEHNKAYNFVTLQQYNYIKSLEEQGKKEEAAIYASQALSDHLKGPLSESLGFVAGRIQFLINDLSNLSNWMHRLAADETLGEKLGKIDKQLSDLDARRAKANGFNYGIPGGSADIDKTLAENANSERSVVLHDQLREANRALDKATQERYAKAGIASSNYLTQLDKERKGATRLQKDLEELKSNIAKRVEAGGPASEPEDAQREAFIRHRDRSFQEKAGAKVTDKLQTAYESERQSLTDLGIRLAAETKNWELYGKSINDSSLAILNVKIAQGKLQGLSGPKIAELRRLAAGDDSAEKIKSETETKVKATAAADKFIAKLNEEANAHATNARETDLATKLAQFEGLGIQKNTAAYANYVDQIERDVQARHDQLLANKLAAEALKNNDEAHKLDEETRALGMSTLQRQIAIGVLKNYNAAQIDIAANKGSETEILDAMALKNDVLTAAITRRYNAQRQGSLGTEQFFQKYQEEATDAAKVAETLASQGVGALENSLTALLSGQKTNFHSLVSAMLSEMTRLQVIKPMLAEIFGTSGMNGSGGGFFGTVLSAFGMGGAAGDGAGGVGLAEGAYPALLATGTNYVPHDNFPALLHKGEAVVPAKYNNGAMGGGSTTINVAAGPTRNEVLSAIQMATQASEARTMTKLRDARVL